MHHVRKTHAVLYPFHNENAKYGCDGDLSFGIGVLKMNLYTFSTHFAVGQII